MFMLYRYKTLRTTLTFPTTQPFRYSETDDVRSSQVYH